MLNNLMDTDYKFNPINNIHLHNYCIVVNLNKLDKAINIKYNLNFSKSIDLNM